MGGVIVMFEGGFMQILGVVPKGTKRDEINTCHKLSYQWSRIQISKLFINMHVNLRINRNSTRLFETFFYHWKRKISK